MPKSRSLDMDATSIQHLCRNDSRLARVIEMIGPIDYSIHDEEPYAFLIHEIIEQMLSVKAGAKIYGRLIDACKGNVCPEVISALSDEELKAIGTSKNKVSYIRYLTEKILRNELDLDSFKELSDADVMKSLTSIKGIGNWTAKMYLIFVLDRQDILPIEDVAFLQSYKWLYQTNDTSPESVKSRCLLWKPYSSVAARYLYRALDSGLVKTEFPS